MIDDRELLSLEGRFCSWGDTVHYNPTPKIFRRAHGHYLQDSHRRVYLDMQAANSSVNFGYGNPQIVRHFIDQLHTLPMLAAEHISEKKVLLSQCLAESVERWTNIKGRIHYNVGGSQAIDDVIKLVARINQKPFNFAFEGSYHGRTTAALSITSSYRYRRPYRNIAGRAHFVPYPYCFRCPYGKTKFNCDLYCLDQFRRLFECEYCAVVDRPGGDCEFGAFFIEPVQGTGGYIIPPSDYFRQLNTILKQHDILLVDDEIQMGFFRTGKMWCLEHFLTEPDVITFGKSLTNGLNPLSGFWAPEKYISPKKWGPGATHSTYSGNPLGMAAGYATMQYIQKNNLGPGIIQRGAYFLDGLRNLQRDFPQIGDVDGLGLAIRVEICHEDGFTPNRELAHRLKGLGLSGLPKQVNSIDGVALSIGGYFKNVLTLAPPLSITKDEVDLFLVMFEQMLGMCIK